MIFTIEPMINAGKRHVKLLPDQWTVVTKDRSLSAQWEHTVLVTADGHEVPRARRGMLRDRRLSGRSGTMAHPPPATEDVLLARAHDLSGRTLGEVAYGLGVSLPPDLRGHKGVVGELIERALGAQGDSRPVPDFEHLGIELKTVPLGPDERPRESTHVCTLALHDLLGQRWETSTVRRKLARVLWIPIATGSAVPLAERRVGVPACGAPAPPTRPFWPPTGKNTWNSSPPGAIRRSTVAAALTCRCAPRPTATPVAAPRRRRRARADLATRVLPAHRVHCPYPARGRPMSTAGPRHPGACASHP